MNRSTDLLCHSLPSKIQERANGSTGNGPDSSLCSFQVWELSLPRWELGWDVCPVRVKESGYGLKPDKTRPGHHTPLLGPIVFGYAPGSWLFSSREKLECRVFSL